MLVVNNSVKLSWWKVTLRLCVLWMCLATRETRNPVDRSNASAGFAWLQAVCSNNDKISVTLILACRGWPQGGDCWLLLTSPTFAVCESERFASQVRLLPLFSLFLYCFIQIYYIWKTKPQRSLIMLYVCRNDFLFSFHSSVLGFGFSILGSIKYSK